MTPRAAPMAPDERRAAIVEAVLPLLQHTSAPTTRQIAEAAAIAEGTVFRAFDDKCALFAAVAERAARPPGWYDAMAAELAALPDLRDKVLATARRMAVRMSEVMAAMMALRTALMNEEPGRRPAAGSPPAFLLESQRELHAAITRLVFDPHRDELRVDPDTAARALRSLVTGTWHPGAAPDDRLTPDEVADLVLDGVRRRS